MLWRKWIGCFWIQNLKHIPSALCTCPPVFPPTIRGRNNIRVVTSQNPSTLLTEVIVKSFYVISQGMVSSSYISLCHSLLRTKFSGLHVHYGPVEENGWNLVKLCRLVGKRRSLKQVWNYDRSTKCPTDGGEVWEYARHIWGSILMIFLEGDTGRNTSGKDWSNWQQIGAKTCH